MTEGLERLKILKRKWANGETNLICGDDDPILGMLRWNALRKDAEAFRMNYAFGGGKDERTIVLATPGPGSDVCHVYMGSGIPWVGVLGKDSTCVVTKAGDLDVMRVLGYLKYSTVEELLSDFRKLIISQLKVMESPYLVRPLGVVSVFHGTDNIHEDETMEFVDGFDETKFINYLREEMKRKEETETMEFVDGFDETKSIKYLQEEMKHKANSTSKETVNVSFEGTTDAIRFLKSELCSKTFTVDETIKTAISAFQLLFSKKFNADEIEVSVMDPNYFLPNGVKHLKTSDIKTYLESSTVARKASKLSKYRRLR